VRGERRQRLHRGDEAPEGADQRQGAGAPQPALARGREERRRQAHAPIVNAACGSLASTALASAPAAHASPAADPTSSPQRKSGTADVASRYGRLPSMLTRYPHRP
jgi:hypothetical protein